MLNRDFTQKIAKLMLSLHESHDECTSREILKQLLMLFRFSTTDDEKAYVVQIYEDEKIGCGRYIKNRDLFNLKRYRLNSRLSDDRALLTRLFDYQKYFDPNYDYSGAGKYGYIYVLSNDSIPDMVKIGFTLRSPFQRSKELSTTGLPTPFKVEYFARVAHPNRLEALTHQALSPMRVSNNREFFKISIEDAIASIEARATYIPLRNLGWKPEKSLE